MPEPTQMFTCTYPIENLQNYLTANKNIDTVHLYVDVKNTATSLFIPDVVTEIVENSKELRNRTDSTIFQGLLLIASNWKYWCKQRDLNFKIFYTNDTGRSTYHRILNDSYKDNRKITNTTLLKYSEELLTIRDKNFELAEKVLNKLDNVYYIKTKYLESDFISYYYISRYCKDKNNILHIIASNDKDMYQSLNMNNVIQYSKKKGNVKLLDKSNFLNEYFKVDSLESDKQIQLLNKLSKFDPKYISVAMSIVGDTSDNVKGVDGLGPNRVAEMFSDVSIVNNLLGDIDSIYQRLEENQNILIENAVPLNNLHKYWRKAIDYNNTITNSFKQIDFEMLSRWMDKRDGDNKIMNYKLINDLVNKENKNLGVESFNNLNKFILEMEDNKLESSKLKVLFS